MSFEKLNVLCQYFQYLLRKIGTFVVLFKFFNKPHVYHSVFWNVKQKNLLFQMPNQMQTSAPKIQAAKIVSRPDSPSTILMAARTMKTANCWSRNSRAAAKFRSLAVVVPWRNSRTVPTRLVLTRVQNIGRANRVWVVFCSDWPASDWEPKKDKSKRISSRGMALLQQVSTILIVLELGYLSKNTFSSWKCAWKKTDYIFS